MGCTRLTVRELQVKEGAKRGCPTRAARTPIAQHGSTSFAKRENQRKVQRSVGNFQVCRGNNRRNMKVANKQLNGVRLCRCCDVVFVLRGISFLKTSARDRKSAGACRKIRRNAEENDERCIHTSKKEYTSLGLLGYMFPTLL